MIPSPPPDEPSQSVESLPSHPDPEASEPLHSGSGRRISARRQPRWLPALGILVLLTGLGFGGQWWFRSRSGAANRPAMAGAGRPQGVPVQLETVEISTIQQSSEFIGSLESPNSVILQPEITGRVSQIYIGEGDYVTAGTPLIQLRPDERQAELSSVLASINSARAMRATARSELEALQADRVAQVAEVDLQEENYQRIVTLVEEGALARDRLDQAVRNRKTAIAQLNALDRRIQAARDRVAEAEAGLNQAQANADRANAQLQVATVTAPFEGVVGSIPVRLGQVVTNSDTLTTVTQNRFLDLRLSIPLERSPDLRPGQRVELTDAAGRVLNVGQISFIESRVDPNAQSILAKATFENRDDQLREGQFVRSRVIWQERPGILVPVNAITRLAGEPFVFVAQAPAADRDRQKQMPHQSPPGQPPALVARQKRVTLGSIQGNSYQVLEGLEPGEQVVVSGVLNLSDGTPILPAAPMETGNSQTDPL